MKNLTKIKKVITLAICLGVVLISTSVFADDNTFTDLSNTLNTTSNTTSNTTNTSNTANTINTTNTTNTTNTSNLTTNTTSNTTSLYANNTTSNLPSTGLQDSLPIVVLVVVLGISAVYAYKKIKDYQNI